MAASVPFFSLNAATYKPGETIQVTTFHLETITGGKYVEILWEDTKNTIYRTELNQSEFSISAPKNEGNYIIRIVAGYEELQKRFTVTGNNTIPCSLKGVIKQDNAGRLLGVLLQWELAGDNAYYITRTQRDGAITSYGPIRTTSWIDGNVDPNKTYLYSVSNELTTSNDVVLDLTNFVSAEYVSGNNCEGVIQLMIGSPYMTVDNQSELIDSESSVVPVIIEGRTMLPIRALVERMGGTVAWNNGSGQASVILEAWGRHVEIPIGSTTVFVDGESRAFDTPARVEQGRTLVPVRHLELLGCIVEWIPETQCVFIKYHVADKAK